MRNGYGLTSEESAAVLKGDAVVPPLPGTLADLADDEEDDSEGCTKQCCHHQELEAEYETLKHKDSDHEVQRPWCATIINMKMDQTPKQMSL